MPKTAADVLRELRDLFQVAAHEAGHCVAVLRLGATLIEAGVADRRNGVTRWECPAGFPRSSEGIVAAAGHVAERLLCGTVRRPAKNSDDAATTRLAKLERPRDPVEVRWAWREAAERLVRANRDATERIAWVLFDARVFDARGVPGDAVRRIVGPPAR